MNRFLAFVAMLIPLSAAAQSVTLPLDSVWAVWDSTAKHAVSVTLLRRNATTGALEAISGQRVSVGAFSFRSLEMRAQFPGQKTSSMIVAGVRLFHSAVGDGWDMPEHPINVPFPASVEVPAGRPLGCTYSMPLTGKGALTCTVDSTVVTGVILPPPPAPAPAPVPAPTPAPTPAPSLAGITVAAVQVVDVTTKATLFALTDGMTVAAASVVRASLVATISGTPSSVTFTLDNAELNTEGGAPWMTCGDWNPCARLWTVGPHALVVAPAGGTPLTIRFTVQ